MPPGVPGAGPPFSSAPSRLAIGVFGTTALVRAVLETAFRAADRRTGIAVRISLGGYDGPGARAFAGNLLDALGRLPGVEGAAVASGLPESDPEALDHVRVHDVADGVTPVGSSVSFMRLYATASYFDTVGIEVQAGTAFQDFVDGAPPLQAVIRESGARAMWSDGPAIGRPLLVFDGIARETLRLP